MPTATAEGLVRALIDNVNQRLGAGIATKFYNDAGEVCALVQVSTGNHSKKAIVCVKTTGLASQAKDALGLSQRQEHPHVAQVLFDSNAGGASFAQKMAVLGEALKCGTLVEWYEADDVAIDYEDDVIAGNLKASYQPLPYRDVGAI